MEIRRDFYLNKLIIKKEQWINQDNYRYSQMRQIIFAKHSFLSSPSGKRS